MKGATDGWTNKWMEERIGGRTGARTKDEQNDGEKGIRRKDECQVLQDPITVNDDAVNGDDGYADYYNWKALKCF